MLSVLIPIYNYNAYPLVLELHKQCTECGIEFEIICIDDCSNQFLNENRKITSLKNCIFKELEKNIGRSRIINLLVSKARFQYSLILDCDTFPKETIFINNYLEIIRLQQPDLVYGGILYIAKKPKKEALLRWVYGTKRETISVTNRIKNPFNTALTSNILIKTSVVTEYPFDETITRYGNEDLCFLSSLKSNKFSIVHIENPSFHLNLETSLQFLNKTKIALENLLILANSEKITKDNSRLYSIFLVVKKYRLSKLIGFLFVKTERYIQFNLLSENPSLLLFDLYKLGYFCKIKNENVPK